MAVGAIYAGWLIGDGAVTLARALAFIHRHRDPEFSWEGAVVSSPTAGLGPQKSFGGGVLSWSRGTCRRCPDHLLSEQIIRSRLLLSFAPAL